MNPTAGTIAFFRIAPEDVEEIPPKENGRRIAVVLESVAEGQNTVSIIYGTGSPQTTGNLGHLVPTNPANRQAGIRKLPFKDTTFLLKWIREVPLSYHLPEDGWGRVPNSGPHALNRLLKLIEKNRPQ